MEEINIKNQESQFSMNDSAVNFRDSEPSALNIKIRKTTFPDWTKARKQGRQFKKTRLTSDKNEVDF